MVEFAGHRAGDHGDVLGGMVEFVGHTVEDHGKTRVDTEKTFKHSIVATSLGEIACRVGGCSSAGPGWTAGCSWDPGCRKGLWYYTELLV